MSKLVPVSRLPLLTPNQHDRDVVGFEYVYPVVSRRAGGVSIGINLNPNNACNWRCIYCQVEGLVRGSAPRIDLTRLQAELTSLLDAVEHGDFLQRHVPSEHRRLRDLAISGNGEPTSCLEFPQVVELLGQAQRTRSILAGLPVTLITNGSLAGRDSVQAALGNLARIGGRVWFKLDAGSDVAMRRINSSTTRLTRHLARLSIVARLCPTEIQSCWFRLDGQDPDPSEVRDYLDALRQVVQNQIPIRGVQLYTLARESLQPESSSLSAVSSQWLEELARGVAELGLVARVVR